ncbi:MAG TPA: histone deacetylase [Nitrospirae bacterium]|nr:histone deacetylase [Nitrospirota bacterium]
MKRTGFFYDDIFLKHETPQWHPESKERLNAIIAKVRATGLWDAVEHIAFQKAGLSDIETVHDPEYVERVSNSPPGYLDPDTFFSAGTLDASLFAAGSVMEAVNQCRGGKIDRAFCAVRPPGHHAGAGRAMGFCIFNNIAVGARHAQKKGYGKVFIADFDVHHGNGTEDMFYEDDTVFYFSTHQYPHYPGTGSISETGKGRGKGFTYNIPMHHGAGDREYEKAYNETLHKIVNDFDPDIILVSAGYDLHKKDPLSGINVSNEGIKSIVNGILTSGKDVPVIFSLEGGYDLQALGDSVVITIEQMMENM